MCPAFLSEVPTVPNGAGPESFPAGGRPEVDPAVEGVTLDLRELDAREVQPFERGDVRLVLRVAARADQGRRDALVAEHPRERELCERLAALHGELVQRADA